MALRFVILAHTINAQTHFDLMLETTGEEKLRTYQLARWPLAVGESCAAPQIGAHRRVYLDYEGEISNGRGSVARVLAGTWTDAEVSMVLSTGEELRVASGKIRRIK